MTCTNHTPAPFDDDLPTVPRARVRIAEGPHENLFALAQRVAGMARRNIEDMDDEDLVPLLMEPEFLDDCSGLERELIIRLSSRLKLEKTRGRLPN